MTKAAASRAPRSKRRKLPVGGRRRGKNPPLPSAVPLTSLPGAVVTTDQAGAITFVSAEAARLAGWTAKTARGRLIGELLKHFPPRRGQRAVSFRQWLRSRNTWNTLWRCQLTPRRGRMVPVQLRAQPLTGAAGADGNGRDAHADGHVGVGAAVAQFGSSAQGPSHLHGRAPHAPGEVGATAVAIAPF